MHMSRLLLYRISNKVPMILQVNMLVVALSLHKVESGTLLLRIKVMPATTYTRKASASVM